MLVSVVATSRLALRWLCDSPGTGCARILVAAINLFQFELDKPRNRLCYFYKKHLRPRCPPYKRSGCNVPLYPLSGVPDITYPEWKRLWVSFLWSILVPKFSLIFLKIWNLSPYSFGKQYKNVLLSCQNSSWFSFHAWHFSVMLFWCPSFPFYLLPLMLLIRTPCT